MQCIPSQQKTMASLPACFFAYFLLATKFLIAPKLHRGTTKMSTTKPKCKPNDIQLREIDVFDFFALDVNY